MTDSQTNESRKQAVDEHLAETLVERQTLHQGNFLTLRRDTVKLPDGKQATREYVVHPGAVVIVPMLDDGRVLMEHQFRYPVGRVMLELPAGKLDAGEDPLVCGQRELAEETGYRASEWAKAGAMHLAIGYSTEVIHIYFARGLTKGDRSLDEGEFLDVLAMPADELLQACCDGRVTDAKTLSCCLWLQNWRDGRWPLEWRPA